MRVFDRIRGMVTVTTGRTCVVRRNAKFAALLAVGLSVAVSGCAHKPQPGEEIADCGPEYQLRAKQISLPNARPGIATVDIVTSDRYENIANVQIGFGGAPGRFFVDQLPRTHSYTDSRGILRVDWEPADSGSEGGTSTLVFDALDFPGNCRVEIEVTI